MSNYSQKNNSNQYKKNTDDLSAAERYAFELNNNDPKYYAQVPAILFHCTYVALETRKDNINFGKMVRKKLSPYAITLYTFIKQLAGRAGEVWTNTRELSELCDMSTGSISSAKRELLQPMEQLNSKTLLEITKKKKKFTHPDGRPGITEYDVCIPSHIWPENNAYMATIKFHEMPKLGPIEEHDLQGSVSQCERDDPSVSHCEHAPLGSVSQCERINNGTDKEAYLFNKTEATAEPPVCSLDQDPSVPSDQPESDVFEEVDSFREKEEKVKDAIRSLGGDEGFIRWAFKAFPVNRVISACHYVYKRNKIKPVEKPIAYLRMALQKGYV